MGLALAAIVGVLHATLQPQRHTTAPSKRHPGQCMKSRLYCIFLTWRFSETRCPPAPLLERRPRQNSGHSRVGALISLCICNITGHLDKSALKHRRCTYACKRRLLIFRDHDNAVNVTETRSNEFSGALCKWRQSFVGRGLGHRQHPVTIRRGTRSWHPFYLQ